MEKCLSPAFLPLMVPGLRDAPDENMTLRGLSWVSICGIVNPAGISPERKLQRLGKT